MKTDYDKKIIDLFGRFPVEMEELFWEIKNTIDCWELSDYLESHKINDMGKCEKEDIVHILQIHARNYGFDLPKINEMWVALTTKNLQENIRAELVNLEIVSKFNIVNDIAKFFTLKKEVNEIPGLIIYFYPDIKNKLMPHFYFTE